MTRAKGTYSLLLQTSDETELEVGALGPIEFPAGYYAYTGSALGPGGFARIDRHRRVHTGQNPTRHWHIDYLLPHTEILDVFQLPETEAECTIAQRLPGEPIAEFGSSDCSCHSHLRYTHTKNDLETALNDEY